MNADAVLEFVRRQPFEPFRITMSNGERHDIHLPECVIVMKSKVIVGYPEEDRTVHCSLIHINAIESLQAA
jgi:hypothetical protein